MLFTIATKEVLNLKLIIANGPTLMLLDEKLIAEGATEPHIHDFAFYNADQDNNYIDDFWLQEKKLLLVVHDVKKADSKGH